MSAATPELEALLDCREQVTITIRNNINSIAKFLEKEGIINLALYNQVTNPLPLDSPDNLAQLVYQRLQNMVQQNEKYYEVFVNYLRESPYQYEKTLNMLDRAYMENGGTIAGEMQFATPKELGEDSVMDSCNPRPGRKHRQSSTDDSTPHKVQKRRYKMGSPHEGELQFATPKELGEDDSVKDSPYTRPKKIRLSGSGDSTSHKVQSKGRIAMKGPYAAKKKRKQSYSKIGEQSRQYSMERLNMPYDFEADKSVVNKLKTLDQMFMDLKWRVSSKLKSKKFDDIKEEIICKMDDKHYSECLTQALEKSNNVQSLFLNITVCWNVLDIDLLKLLIKIFCKEDIQIRQMETEYDEILEWVLNSSIRTVVEALAEANVIPKTKPNSNFTLMTQYSEIDADRCSMKRLNNIRKLHINMLGALNLLHTALMVYQRATINCVVVTWLILVDDKIYFEQMFNYCIAKGLFFEENAITKVEIDGQIFMPMEIAIFEAVNTGDIKRTDELLDSWNKYHHDINKLNKEKETCLIRASQLGYSEIVALLLEEESLNIDYQMSDTLWTAYFFAHSCGHRRIVNLLKEYGADLHLKDKDGKTAMDISILPKDIQTESPWMMWSTFLMELASPVIKAFLWMLTTQHQQLFKACETGTVEEVKNLLEQLSKERDVINITDGEPRNWTLLMWACSNGNYDVAKFLIERRANIHAKSTLNDWTALHIAASRNYLRIVNLLLKEGAEPNDIIDSADTHYSGLMYISDMGFNEVARVYLKYKADVKIAAKDGSTPLLAAVESKNKKLVLLYLEHEANCNKQTEKGWTPLMESARKDCADICKILLEHGACTNLTMKNSGNATGESALHVACYFGSAKVVKLLIEGHIEVNRENQAGLTPLMIAIKQNHVSVVSVLVKCESLDINHQHQDSGVSAIVLAGMSGNIEICEILLQHGADPRIEGFFITDNVLVSMTKKAEELIQKCCESEIYKQGMLILKPILEDYSSHLGYFESIKSQRSGA